MLTIAVRFKIRYIQEAVSYTHLDVYKRQVLGLVAYALYHNYQLSLVMTAAMTLNLLLAAVMGVVIPIIMTRLGRDPAAGSSVLITAMTDSGGFFIFLGLATLYLL